MRPSTENDAPAHPFPLIGTRSQERLLFHQLAVFAGSFSAQAVAAICAEAGAPTASMLSGLSRLVGTSLVMVQDRTHVTHYRLLEPLRHYAQGRQEQTGAYHAVQQRHRD